MVTFVDKLNIYVLILGEPHKLGLCSDGQKEASIQGLDPAADLAVERLLKILSDKNRTEFRNIKIKSRRLCLM